MEMSSMLPLMDAIVEAGADGEAPSVFAPVHVIGAVVVAVLAIRLAAW